MKRVLWILPLVLLLGAGAARAQETPEWEFSGGYSYLRANISGTGPSFNLNGGYGSITENLNNWFGGRFELNAWGGTLSGTNVTAQTFTYGPVLSLRRFSRWTPFAHAQFGAVHASSGFEGISKSDSKLAMTFGGGLDFRLGSRAAFRVQGDYLYTRFLDVRQNNIVVNAGLVIYLGKK